MFLPGRDLPPVLDGMAKVGLCDSSDKGMALVIFLFDFSIDFTLYFSD